MASIIGLPIALWQLRDVKTKVKASQIAVDNMENMIKFEKLDSIQERLNNQHDRFVKLKSKLGVRGNSEKSENDSLTAMLLELNHCDHDLPIGFYSVSEKIRSVITNIEEMINGEKDTDHIRKTEESIREAIGTLKIEIEKGDKALLIAVANKGKITQF